MTETKTLTLAEFLLARIDEDEAEATSLLRSDAVNDADSELSWGFERDYGPTGYLNITPARVLAECEAKRRIVEQAFRIAATIDGEWGCCHGPEAIRTGRMVPDFDDEAPEDLPSGCPGPDVAARFLSPLAAAYSDHPDYRPEFALPLS